MKKIQDSTIVVQIAKPEDAEVLADILSSGVKNKVAHGDMVWGSEPYTADELRERIAKGNTYIARLANQPVGTLMLLWDDKMTWGEQPPVAAYVHQLVVDDSHRGMGLGKRLLDWASQQAAKDGKELLRLDVPHDNKGLKSYYEKLGFQWVQDKEVHSHSKTYTVSLYERQIV